MTKLWQIWHVCAKQTQFEYLGKRFMAPPSVSVIIPTYNREAVIGEAIRSVLSQETRPDQIIVVDDGSTDDTSHLLKAFEGQIEIHSQQNGGAASARNAGIKRATGDWLAFLDSDDLWLPDRMAIFHRDIAKASSNTVAHIADVAFANDHESLFTSEGITFPTGEALCLTDPFDTVIPGPLLQASVLKASSVQELGGFSEDLPIHEDTLLFKRLSLMGDWLISGDRVAKYRRVDEDEVALMDWEHSRPIPFFQSRVQANTWLLRDQRLTGERRKRVTRDQSGAYFQLAAAYAKIGEGANARRALIDSVQCFPRPKTIIRAMASAIFGPSVNARILSQRTVSLHPDPKSNMQNEAGR